MVIKISSLRDLPILPSLLKDEEQAGKWRGGGFFLNLGVVFGVETMEVSLDPVKLIEVREE